jgi:hypothetical protein
VAYGFDREPDACDVAVRLGRVEEHYGRIWNGPTQKQGVSAGRCGLYVWDASCSPSRWPSWADEGDLAVATLHVPLGYEAVIGDLSHDRAPFLLARTLAERPWEVLELAPPFVVASLSRRRRRLQLHTDGLGLGRLFELRFAGGWVWSNRQGAACRFAGVPSAPDRDAWRTFAATGWFLGRRSPFGRVVSLSAGVSIRFDALGRTESRVDTLAAWSVGPAGDRLSRDRIDEVAHALKRMISSLARSWSGRVFADLSGGRDSRLVVAAALAAGVDITIRTNASEEGEGAIAEELIRRLPETIAGRVAHHVINRDAGDDVPAALGPVLPNALRWHRCQEGLRPSTYLSTPAPSGLSAPRDVIIGGGGGEIAHGHYYPDDYRRFERLPEAERVDALADQLARKVMRVTGPSAQAKAASAAHIRRTLDAAHVRGLVDVTMLDYFYAAERLRRWGSAGETLGRFSPLLSPAFIRAAFACTAEERVGNLLHRAVTARLIPEWEDVPYYRRPAGVVAPALRPRIGAAPDRDAVSAIVDDPSMWGDAFDPRAVVQSWRLVLDGRGRPQDEELIQRVCWLVTFDGYCSEVNGVTPTAFIARSSPALTGRPRLIRGRRFAARALRRVARSLD